MWYASMGMCAWEHPPLAPSSASHSPRLRPEPLPVALPLTSSTPARSSSLLFPQRAWPLGTAGQLLTQDATSSLSDTLGLLKTSAVDTQISVKSSLGPS